MHLKDLFLANGSRSGRYIMDSTGVDRKCRGLEIQEWLDQNDFQVGKFVIIDDSDDMRDLTPHLIKTDWSTGLLQEHVDQIYEYFAGDSESIKAQLENKPALEWSPATPYAVGDIVQTKDGLVKITDEGSSSGRINFDPI